MTQERPTGVVEISALSDRIHVFAGRREAGLALAVMLEPLNLAGDGAIVLAIPAGGVPVGAAVADHLALPLSVAIVSKATPPWNAEVGYGAVAFDGTVRLNDAMVARLDLTAGQVEQGVNVATEKVRRRVARLLGAAGVPELSGRTVVLVDDGLASGFTMRLAADVLRRRGVRRLLVAVPTGHVAAAERVLQSADAVYCANLRRGYPFAVAEAYEHWRDVDDDEAADLLAEREQA